MAQGLSFSATASTNSNKPYGQSITARHHALNCDVPESMAGIDSAMTPHELLLGALASCTAITITMYANRKGWNLGDVSVSVDESVDPETKAVTLHKTIRCSESLSEEQWEKILQVAEKCPVNQLMKAPLAMTCQAKS